jgi:hypothetical protein
MNFTEKQNKKVLLILNFPLIDNYGQIVSAGMISQHMQLQLLQSFTGEIIQSDEQFWLYEVTQIKK